MLALALGIGASSDHGHAALRHERPRTALPRGRDAGRRHRRADALAGRTGAVRRSSRRGDRRRAASIGIAGRSRIRRSILATDAQGTDQFGGTFLSFITCLRLLHERPMLGRDFLPEDDRGRCRHRSSSSAIASGRIAMDRIAIGHRPHRPRRTAKPRRSSASCRRGLPIPVDTQVWRPLSSFPDIQQRALPSVRSESSAVWPAASTGEQAQARARRDPVDALTACRTPIAHAARSSCRSTRPMSASPRSRCR